MAELRTPGERSQEKPPFDPPRGDEGLDDWFARRLESQGIKARRAASRLRGSWRSSHSLRR